MEKNSIKFDTANYRQNRDLINKDASKVRTSHELLADVAEYFFDVPKGTLSEEELQKFSLFAEHARKRIVANTFHNEKIFSDASAKEYFEFNDIAEPQMIHDLAHALVAYDISGKASSEVFSTDEKDYVNNKKLIAEEIYALVWTGVTSTAISLAKTSPSFEDFAHDYISWMCDFFEKINTDHIESLYKDKDEAEITEKKEEYKRIVKEIKGNPDPKLIATLKNIYENKDDQKVLYKEFERIADPLIKKLQKREK